MSVVQITPGAEIATGAMPPSDRQAVNELIERLDDDGNLAGAIEIDSLGAYRVRAHDFWLVFDHPEPGGLRILDVVPNTRARMLYRW